MRLALVFLLGALAGFGSGVAYLGSGDGFGDYEYTHYDFTWRGRHFEIDVEDRTR